MRYGFNGLGGKIVLLFTATGRRDEEGKEIEGEVYTGDYIFIASKIEGVGG